MTGGQEKDRAARPYIGMHFKCCNVYRRVYLNAEGTAFHGHCPKCARPAKVKAAPGGGKSRFWSAE